MDTFIQDLKYSVRQLLARPGFAVVLVLTLGLGVGANTAVFSVVHAVLLNPLPYPQPDRLAVVWTQFPSMDLNEFPASWPEYSEFRDQTLAFEEVGAFTTGEATLTGDVGPERVDIASFTWTMFPVLGVDALPGGRVFGEAEDLPGADNVALISHGLWERRFGSDPGVVGSTLQLNGAPITVLGVMPPRFAFPNPEIDAWLPMGVDPANPPGRSNHFANLIGRLAPGVTPEAAQTDLRGLLERWTVDASLGHSWSTTGHPAFVRPLHEDLVGNVETSLFVLLGAVGLVLLIACSNVANLLLVRGEGRQRELSIRSAMGADRSRIVRQLLTESLVMAIVGGVVGIAFAFVGLEALLALAPDDLPRLGDVGLNGTVLAFSGGIALLAGLFFGLAPALQATRVEIQAALRDEGRGTTSGRGRFRVRQLLVVSEVALTMVLLIAAGLLIQSFWRLQGVDPGFEADQVLALSVDTPPGSYPAASDVTAFYRDLMARVDGLPGVSGAGAVWRPPLTGSLPPNDIQIEDHQPDPDGPPMNADIQLVTPGYFETMAIPVLEGRVFDAADDEVASVVAVIDRELAERHFPGETPLGRRIRQTGAEWATIVGVVGDVRQEGLDIEPRANLYLAHAQGDRTWFAARDMTLLLRTTPEPLGLVSTVRRVVSEMDADMPVYEVTTMAATVSRSTATRRFVMVLQLVFAAIALLLAAVGIYGVLSYSVAQRTQEIGIRMALGAERGTILRLVVGQGMLLVAVSIAIGIGGALVAAQVLSTMLYGIAARDPLTYGAVAVVLIAVALLACWIPARRASALSPQSALRYD